MKLLKTPLTIGLIIINLIVYLTMIVNGVDLFLPASRTIVDWGGIFDPFVVKGEWWRLVSSMFIHIGCIHLVLNVVTLYSLGKTFEVKYGTLCLFMVYFTSGIAGGIASVYSNMFQVGAGASGAIFGIAGALIAMLLLEGKGDKFTSRSELVNIFVFILINVIFSLRFKFIDLAAHLGGLLVGFFTGASLQMYLSYRSQLSRAMFIFGIIILLNGSLLFLFASNFPKYRYWYFTMFQSFIKNDEETISILKNPKSYTSALVSNVNIQAADNIWKENLKILKIFKNVPPDLKQDIKILKNYITLRRTSLNYFKEYLDQHELAYLDSVDRIIKKIEFLPQLKYKIGFYESDKENIRKPPVLIDFRTYYDSAWQITSERNAVYYRVAQRDSTGNLCGKVYDYYKSGHFQMKGIYNQSVQNGPFFYFYENGNYQSYGEYKLGSRIGLWKQFYENGNIKGVVDYSTEYLQLEFWDKFGNHLVKEGMGAYENYFDNGLLSETGSLKNGRKNGIWKGFHENGKPFYLEKYLDGKLIAGQSEDKNGNHNYYQSAFTDVSPIGLDSNQSYTEYLKLHLVYPDSAKVHRVEGIVLMEFDVDTDGVVKNVQALNQLGFGCEQEAKRVIINGLKFKSAYFHGVPIRKKVNHVPVRFSLR